MRRASIDIGSNSVLLLVVEVDEKNRIVKELLNESFITSLGRDLDLTKKFHPESMQATYEALSTYKKLLDDLHFPIGKVVVTATEASRVSTNSREFFKKIKRDLGFETQIISSVGEAYYTALGVVSSLKESGHTIVVMDIGGASTELIHIQTHPFRILRTISLPMGSVRATEWKKKGELKTKVHDITNCDLSAYSTEQLVCVAGSMTALASMYLARRDYQDAAVEGLDIPFESFCHFSQQITHETTENLQVSFPFLGKRAPMVGAGAFIAEVIGQKLAIKDIKISTRGLRYGTAITGGIDEQFIRE